MSLVRDANMLAPCPLEARKETFVLIGLGPRVSGSNTSMIGGLSRAEGASPISNSVKRENA